MLIQDGRYLAKRSSEPIALPTDEGISGVVDATDGPTATASLALDPGASAGSAPAAPIFTVVQTTLPTQSGNAAGAASSGKSIPVSAVIGSCIGAFIFVSALIIFGVWFYRRYSESLRRRALSRGSLKLRLKPAQRRPWSKLEDDEDKWTNTNQTKEVDQVDQVVPMEKLTMFKRAASVRTAYTQKSVDDHTLTYPHSFAPFDINLVRTLSADPTIDPHSQSQSSISIKTPKLSPSTTNFGEPFNMAIPTPEATVLQSHKWESAEVVQYEGQEVVEPSVQDKSLHNPFFGSLDYSRSRPSEEKSPNAKGKEATHDSIYSSLLSPDPFEALVAKLPKPSLHQPTDSSQSKSRALQTLMGALELSEDEVRDRLRVASMQLSDGSHYATPTDEEFADKP